MFNYTHCGQVGRRLRETWSMPVAALIFVGVYLRCVSTFAWSVQKGQETHFTKYLLFVYQFKYV